MTTAAAISEAVGRPVTYRDLSVEDYAAHLQGVGLDAGTAGFVAALDGSAARGELETTSEDLAALLGRLVTPLQDVL